MPKGVFRKKTEYDTIVLRESGRVELCNTVVAGGQTDRTARSLTALRCF